MVRGRLISAIIGGVLAGSTALLIVLTFVLDSQPTPIPNQVAAASIPPPANTLHPSPTVTIRHSTPVSIPPPLSLFFTGDMMFDRKVALRSATSTAYPFEKLGDTPNNFIKNADLFIANLEGPVTPLRRAPVKSIDFAFDPKIVPMLKQQGIDVVSQANNHTLDQGRDGAADSRKYLAEQGIAFFGDQVHDDATSSRVIVEARGKKIAFLGFNITDNPLDEEAAFEAVSSSHPLADYVIVFMHWGNEYHDHPTAGQVELAHKFIDAGVDAVIGAHPHWRESLEVYKHHPIAYSLGNFIFDQDFSEETQQGLTLGLTFGDQIQLELFPVRIDRSQPRFLLDDERKLQLEHLAKISDSSLSEQIKQGMITISNK